VTAAGQGERKGFAERFNATAPGYDHLEFTRRAALRLVELGGLQPGERVLDNATGTGWAAVEAGRRVGPAGRIIGIDISPAMLDIANAKVAASGLSNVEVRLGDAECPELPEGDFDVVLCASGLFFLPDMAAALRAWLELTRPGGRVIFSGFGKSFQQPLVALQAAAVARYGLPPLQGFDRLSDPGVCTALLSNSGWEGAEVCTEHLGYFHATIEDYWTETWHSAMGTFLRRLPEADLARFREEHLAEVRPLFTAEGLWMDIPVHFATARKAP
jgi:ubiquinone/menaquinone biosynthesis C-methylase UbiE